jgi:hypothetical protein
MNERTRQQIATVAGVAGLAMCGLLLFHAYAAHISGGDLYVNNDEFASVMLSITEHKHLFELSALAQILAAVCMVPIALTLAFRFDDNPGYAICAACLMFMAAVVLVIAFTHYGNLTGTSFDYIHNRAPAEIVINKADSISDQFQILEFAGLIIWGIAMVGFSILMARAEDFPSPLAWLTFTVGIVCFAYVRAPLLLDASRIVWSLAVGSYLLWRDPVSVPSTETETETA